MTLGRTRRTEKKVTLISLTHLDIDMFLEGAEIDPEEDNQYA